MTRESPGAAAPRESVVSIEHRTVSGPKSSAQRIVEAKWWLPLALSALGGVTAVSVAWVARPPALPDPRVDKALAEAESAGAAASSCRSDLAATQTTLAVLRKHVRDSDTDVWYAFCVLDLKGERECPARERLPQPMAKSSAPRFQIRTVAQPLGE